LGRPAPTSSCGWKGSPACSGPGAAERPAAGAEDDSDTVGWGAESAVSTRSDPTLAKALARAFR
jgi:hypothetical protein